MLPKCCVELAKFQSIAPMCDVSPYTQKLVDVRKAISRINGTLKVVHERLEKVCVTVVCSAVIVVVAGHCLWFSF